MTAPVLSARTVAPHELDAREAARWEELCRTVPALASPFLSVHYARAVAASGGDVRVCVIARDGAPCAFLPYQMAGRLGRWLKSAEPVGGAMSDYFGLVAEPGLALEPRALLRLARLNHLAFSHLDETQLEFGLQGEQPRTGLRVRLDHSGGAPLDALLAQRQKYRKDTERRMRQLAAEVGPLDFVFDAGCDRAALVDRLVMHKRAQYARTGAPDALAEPWKTRLLAELSGYRFDSCRAVLSTLSAGEHWLAMHIGLVGNGVLQYWLPVYNPALSKYAPGRLLIHHIIAASATAAIHTIDRGEGDTASKRELANDEHHFLRGVWNNKSPASHLTSGLNSIKWRLATRGK
jgi:CelD/BcsL family acetyltransferase involved in cellulose biosynthesis